MPRPYHFDKELMQCAVDNNWHAMDFLTEIPVPEDLDSDDDTEEMQEARKKPPWWGEKSIVLSAVKQDWHAILQAFDGMWESGDIVINAIRSFYRDNSIEMIEANKAARAEQAAAKEAE